MNQIEERLAEEVRKHEHLYNPYRTDRDPQTAYNSWKVISASVGLEVLDCSTLWRKMRDRFVRQNKAMTGSSDSKATAFYIFLSWLEPHIRHREPSSKYDKPSPWNVATKKGPSLSTSVSRLPSLSARRLAEEVRKHEHLYNPYHKDQQTAYNSWKVISASVGLEVLRCSTLWRQMRDRFVRENKAMTGSGDRKATAFYKFLSWLEPHIRHRETSSNYDKPSPWNVATKKGPSLSTSVSRLPSLSARRLAEEVRKHEHLYNPYRTDKDPQTAYNSWKVISANVGLEVLDCSTLWRQMRDRFVRENKAMTGSSDSKATAFYKFLSWLEPHIRHRETSSKYDKPSPWNVATKKGPSLSTPTPEASPETSTSSPEASVQPSTPTHEASVQPSTPTHEASVQPSTPTPEPSVQPPTPTHEASPETSTSSPEASVQPPTPTPEASVQPSTPATPEASVQPSTPATPEASPETSTSSPEASVQPSTPTHEASVQPPTPTHEASVQPPTPTHEASVQPPTPTPEASVQPSTSVSPLPSLPALSTPPAAMRLASPLSRRGRKKRQRAQRGKHDRQRWQRGQRGQYDRQRGQDDGQRRQDDRQMIRLDGQRRQDDGQRGQRGQDDGQMIRLEERRLDGQKKMMGVRDEYSRFGELVAAMMSRVQEDKRTEAMHSVYSLLN